MTVASYSLKFAGVHLAFLLLMAATTAALGDWATALQPATLKLLAVQSFFPALLWATGALYASLRGQRTVGFAPPPLGRALLVTHPSRRRSLAVEAAVVEAVEDCLKLREDQLEGKQND